MRQVLLRSAVIRGAALIFLVSLSACSEEIAEAPDEADIAAPQPAAGTNNEIISDIEDTASAVVGAVDAELTETTQGFAEAISLHIIYQIAAAETAVERSDQPEITDFAESVLEGNSDAQAELARVVEESHIPVRMPDELDRRHQGMLDNLTGASEENFETRFVEQQISANREARTLAGDYAADGRSPPIREFAASLVPQIEQRLARAEALSAELSDEEEG